MPCTIIKEVLNAALSCYGISSSITSFAFFCKAEIRHWAAFLLFVYSRTFLILAWSVFSARTFATISSVNSRSSTIPSTFFTFPTSWLRFFFRNSRWSIAYKGDNKWRNQLVRNVFKHSSYSSCSFDFGYANSANRSDVTCNFHGTSLRGDAGLFLIFKS